MRSTRGTASIAPLYLAGFTTAFGAHGVATALGSESDDIGWSLLGFGLVLAVYDLAEVVLKPLFGSLSDRIGPKPVIVGGLVSFAAASFLVLADQNPLTLGIARVGQGAAAAAFSPASSAAVARLVEKNELGGSFGRYGAWKSLGYVLGPVIGAGLVTLWDIRALYAALATVGILAAGWVAYALPSVPAVPRPRYTLADLVRQTTERGFLVPTMLLATSTAVLGAAVGFLPLLASRLDLHPLAGAATVAVLALVSMLVQPRAGRMRDEHRVSTAVGGAAGLGMAAAVLLLLALAPHATTLVIAAAGCGAMVGVVTPLVFAHLGAVTPDERMGRTMGNAEIGREVGAAGGPLLVGAVATAISLPVSLGALAGLSLVSGGIAWRVLGTTDTGETPHQTPDPH